MTRTVWVIRDGVLVQYERVGECLACGECCSRFTYSYQQTTSPRNQAEHGKGSWTTWEGWAVEDWNNDGKWTWWGPMTITPLDKPKCKQFDPETNLCEKFGQDNWKEICRKFPLRPEDLAGIGNCGFSFKGVI